MKVPYQFAAHLPVSIQREIGVEIKIYFGPTDNPPSSSDFLAIAAQLDRWIAGLVEACGDTSEEPPCPK